MEYSRFEWQVRRLVPDFVVQQFSHLLKAIPETLRAKFVSKLRRYQDIRLALDWLAFSPVAKNVLILEYAHQRMQDNMSEILG